MLSQKISFPEVMFSVASAEYGQVLQALRIWIVFLTSVTGCQSLLFSCWEICWFCSLKAAVYTSSEGRDYALGWFCVASQDIAALHVCQGLFSTQISCPPARRADIWLPLNAPLSKGAFENGWGTYCCVQRGNCLSSWCWHDRAAEQASVTMASNTCLCIFGTIWWMNSSLFPWQALLVCFFYFHISLRFCKCVLKW